ncbi:MAG: CRTAC1 family protein [Candidatus Aminicenantes bacterium]|nr:CRTAC1 family protein [Candidatus Aminicenantes bacterium]
MLPFHLVLAWILLTLQPVPGTNKLEMEGLSSLPQFTDQTTASGIDFHHVSGGLDKKYILEAKGGGAGFFDYDNDGDLDLYMVNGATLDTYQTKSGPGNVLYRNDGKARFANATAEAGVGDAGWGHGCSVGDIDNDGYRDLYVTNYGENVLYHNQADGSFSNITTAAGVGGNLYSSSAAFFDYDNDGDLDLYVAHYVAFDIDNMPDEATRKKLCVFLGGPVYCGPGGMPGTPDILYRNEGNNIFADVTLDSGIDQTGDYYGLGVIPQDYDSDGDVDLFVANDTTPNLLFRNNGHGGFTDEALLAGVAYNADGDEEAGMGVDFGDVDNDGDADLIVTNFFAETNTLYRNNGNGEFTDYTVLAGLASPTLHFVGFGTRFFDYDNDGDLDLFIANGHVYPHVSLIPAGGTYFQSNQLFRNRGDGKYFDVSAQSGPGLGIEKASRGACVGDYDNDGDGDVLVANMNDLPTLLRNDGGNRLNSIIIQVFGTRSNRDGVGTRIRLQTAGETQYRTVNGASSYLSSSDIRTHVGLGTWIRADLIEISWPDGSIDSIADVPANHLLVVYQGKGHFRYDLGANPHSSPPQ